MEMKTRFDWKAALNAGAVAGISALLICLVGMVASFGQRYIISGVLSIGHTLLLMNMILAGFIAVRRARYENRLFTLLSGALAGLVTSAMVAVVVLIGQYVNLRAVLINASTELYRLLTFGQNAFVGLAILLLIGAVLGLLTALVSLLPDYIRRAVVLAFAILLMFGLLRDLLRVMFEGWGPLGGLFLWMFPVAGGLSIPGVVFLLVVAAGISLLGSLLIGPKVRPSVKQWVGKQPRGGQLAVRLGVWALLAALALLAPRILGVYPSEVLNMVGLFALMGLGLNVVVGFCGLLDLGYVAFFAIGAYTVGVLTSPEISYSPHWPFWAALPVAMVAALLSGLILGIPVLNTRGDYLAIVTLGFGEITRLFFLSDWLRPYVGGAQGIQLIAPARIGGLLLTQPRELYYLILAGCLLVIFVSTRLKNSRLGRAWMAVREDEDVAQAMGIGLVNTKLLAFATGATFAGLSGALFATKLGSIYPHSFQLLYSIYVLCLLIVGGMGSIPGVLVGSLLLIGLPELLREFAEYRMLVYGAVLVFMMLTRPQGFLPAKPGTRRTGKEAEKSAP